MASIAQTPGSHGAKNQALCLPSDAPNPADCFRARYCWNNFPLQLQHSFCCHSETERELLTILDEKITAPPGSSYGLFWAKYGAWHPYADTAAIVVCSNYPKREDLIRCGYSSFRCQDRLCPLCCYGKLAGPLKDEYGDSFSADGEVWYLVFSLSTNPDETSRFIFRTLDAADLVQIKPKRIGQPCTPDSYGVPFETKEHLVLCRHIWDWIHEAVRQSTGKGCGKMFTGAVGGPELAVQFQPLRVLPHGNFVVWSQSFTADVARELRAFIRAKMRNSRHLQSGLFPALACYRIKSPEDLRVLTGYITKPIDIATPYSMAADRSSYDPAQMAKLNQEVNSFLKKLPILFLRLPRIQRFGRCNSNHSKYLGYVTQRRVQQRERRQLKAKSAVGQNKPLVRGVKLTAFERWEIELQWRYARRNWEVRSRYSFWHRSMFPPPPPPPGQTPLPQILPTP